MDLSRIDDEFGEALRIARQAKGVTQEELSADVWAMGVKLSQATIGKIERGERKVSVGEAHALSRALHLYSDELVRGISAASAHALTERLRILREELKSALHAFESGQALVEGQGRRLDHNDQQALLYATRESLEDVIKEYRKDQEVANEARLLRDRADGLQPLSPSGDSVFDLQGLEGPFKNTRVGFGHPRARAVILDSQGGAPSDG